jgi:hypothetical protein
MTADELAYRQLPRAVRHWLCEPEIVLQRHIWVKAFIQLDLAADTSPSAAVAMRQLEWLMQQKRSAAEKLAVLMRLGQTTGRVDLKALTGWE